MSRCFIQSIMHSLSEAYEVGESSEVSHRHSISVNIHIKGNCPVYPGVEIRGSPASETTVSKGRTTMLWQMVVLQTTMIFQLSFPDGASNDGAHFCNSVNYSLGTLHTLPRAVLPLRILELMCS
jgi:hypothetical protein